MASAATKMGKLAIAGPVVVPAALGSVAYAVRDVKWADAIRRFFLGEGRTSRILLLLTVLLNLKNVPLGWTVSDSEWTRQDQAY